MRNKKLTLLSSLFAAALGLAVTAGSGHAAGQQGIAGKVVTIGGDVILSGSSLAMQANSAVQIYFDMINREGGVNGYTFKYIPRDNALQPAQGVAVARQLAKSDKVFAMFVIGSAVVQALMPQAPQLQTPMLTMADSSLLSPVVPNVFGVNVRYDRLPLFEAQYAIKKLGRKKIAYVYEDTAIGHPALKTLPAFVAENGARLVATLPFPVDATDWAPYAARVKDAGADAVVFFGSGASQLPGMQKAADAIGYHPKYVAIYANLIPAYLKLAGPLAEGTYIDSQSIPVDSASPNAKLFRDELTKAGQASAIGAFAGQGWTGAAIIVEGVRRATANGAALTWASFDAALETIHDVPLGMFPSITYTKQDHTGATKAAMFEVQNGKFVEVQPLTDIP